MVRPSRASSFQAAARAGSPSSPSGSYGAILQPLRWIQSGPPRRDQQAVNHRAPPPGLGCPMNIRFISFCRAPHKERNWLHVGREVGGHRAATLFMLMVRCPRLRVDPYGYLCDILGRLGTHPQKDILERTPRGWRDARARRDGTGGHRRRRPRPPDDRAADPDRLTWRPSAGRVVNLYGPSLPTSAASPRPSLSLSSGLPCRARVMTGRPDGNIGQACVAPTALPRQEACRLPPQIGAGLGAFVRPGWVHGVTREISPGKKVFSRVGLPRKTGQ